MIKTKQAYDVVVIGSGGAGLRAGIGAALNGAKTLVVSRGKINRSGATLLAGANISADVACDGESLARLGISDQNKKDTREDWFFDLVHEGFFLNNQKLLELFVDTAADRIKEMMDWGLTVRGMEGDREISVFGSDILDALYGRAKSLKVEFAADTAFADLVTEDGAVKGVVCLDLLEGQLCYYPSKAVILATGGAHDLFPSNSGSTDLCGDGQAAALRAGASLVDMEMISFCPTVITDPVMYRGNILPYIFFSTGYGQLTNKYGKTFTHRYLSPRVEQLALDTEWNKMLLSYALQQEIQSGRANLHGGIYFSLALSPAEISEELYRDLPPLKKGIYADIMKGFQGDHAVTVQPAAHYFEGGVKINQSCETALPGLYAAGECTGGMFGANRVSAATTEMLVEGARAGESAGEFVKEISLCPASSFALEQLESVLCAGFERRGDLTTSQALGRLRSCVGESLTVLRNEETLIKALEEVSQVEDQLSAIGFADHTREYNREWMEFIRLRNMTLTARGILQSALIRKESRGVHVRSDHPVTDDAGFLNNIVVDGADLSCHTEAVVFHRLSPKPMTQSYTGYVERIVEQLQEKK